MLIGLSGSIGAGKDTIADYLVEKYNFRKVSFASKLKDIVAILYDWDREMLEGNTSESREWRERDDEYWKISPRKALMYVGTKIFRKHFGEDVWVNIVKKQICNRDLGSRNLEENIVITDCRYKNEEKMIKELKGKIIYVFRGSIDNKEQEYEMKSIDYDICIENNSTKDNLYKIIDCMYQNLRDK
jgi:hypothetical protein